MLTKTLDNVTTIAIPALKTIMTANFVINVMMASSLQQLWGTLNILQLILHTPLLQIQISKFVFDFCSGLVSIANFQIFSAEPLTNIIFGKDSFSPDSMDPINDRFNLLGYTQKNIVLNMDLSLYIFFSCFLSGTAFLLLKSMHLVYPTTISLKIEQFLLSQIKMSWFIRFFIESNFQLLIVVQLQFMVF